KGVFFRADQKGGEKEGPLVFWGPGFPDGGAPPAPPKKVGGVVLFPQNRAASLLCVAGLSLAGGFAGPMTMRAAGAEETPVQSGASDPAAAPAPDDGTVTTT